MWATASVADRSVKLEDAGDRGFDLREFPFDEDEVQA